MKTLDEKDIAEIVRRRERSVWLELLNLALRGLGSMSTVGETPVDLQLRIGRQEAMRAEFIAALRKVCEDHGDNDWPDELHPADIINKHLLPYLEE